MILAADYRAGSAGLKRERSGGVDRQAHCSLSMAYLAAVRLRASEQGVAHQPGAKF
jgi:hypothetical protein